jgi:hypothetical protein
MKLGIRKLPNFCYQNQIITLESRLVPAKFAFASTGPTPNEWLTRLKKPTK